MTDALAVEISPLEAMAVAKHEMGQKGVNKETIAAFAEAAAGLMVPSLDNLNEEAIVDLDIEPEVDQAVEFVEEMKGYMQVLDNNLSDPDVAGAASELVDNMPEDEHRNKPFTSSLFTALKSVNPNLVALHDVYVPRHKQKPALN